MRMTISKDILRKEGEVVLPPFTFEDFTQEQADKMVDLLLNEYFRDTLKDTKGGNNAVQ